MNYLYIVPGFILLRYLDEVALHHLIDALCKLSSESMELAYTNRVSLCVSASLCVSPLVSLYVRLSLCVCQSVCVCVSDYLSMCQSVRVSVSLSVCQSVGQSLRQTVSLCVSLSVCMSVCLCLFVCASLYMSDSLSVCQSGFGKTPVPTPKRYLVWIFTIIVNPPNEIHMLRWSNWIGPCVHLFDSSFVWQNVNYRWLFSLTCSYMYCRGKLENAGITVIFLLLCFW